MEQDPIEPTLNYEQKEPIFWRVFKDLSDKANELVEHDKLQERLISTGKFYASEAFMIIEHMEHTGKIEDTGGYRVYRIAPPKP